MYPQRLHHHEGFDWPARGSLLLVIAACLLVAWRLSVTTPGSPFAGRSTPSATADSDAGAADEPKKAAAHAVVKAPASAVPPLLQSLMAAGADGGSAVVPFRLNQPDMTLLLPPSLDEISDLALAADGKSLWAVHDEQRKVFRLAIANAEVLQTIDLGAKGDYEGVAALPGNKIVVVRSDGKLLMVDLRDQTVSRLELPLTAACNIESVVYQKHKNSLLLACKNPSSEKGKRAWPFYEFDLEKKKLKKEPVFSVTRLAVERYLDAHPEQHDLPRWAASKFSPSGMTVHPRSGQLWLVSGPGQLLAVLDPDDGQILRIERLDYVVHQQPEGIAFSADGESLFISNEARGQRATLHRFSRVMK